LSDSNIVFKHKDDIRYRVVGEEAVVVRQKEAEVMALNAVGARVLELIDADKTLRQVIETMASEYDVAPEELARDVELFVAEMRDAGIVEEVREEVR
jgi:hypothetical protein